jgi:hypothetical protein
MCYNLFRFIFWIVNLMIECKSILACMFLSGYYLNGEESLWYSRTMRKVHNNTHMAGKGSEKITAWLAKVGIMLMLDNLIWREKFCQRTNTAWREKDKMTHVLIGYPTLGKRIFWSRSCAILILFVHIVQ